MEQKWAAERACPAALIGAFSFPQRVPGSQSEEIGSIQLSSLSLRIGLPSTLPTKSHREGVRPLGKVDKVAPISLEMTVPKPGQSSVCAPALGKASTRSGCHSVLWKVQRIFLPWL